MSRSASGRPVGVNQSEFSGRRERGQAGRPRQRGASSPQLLRTGALERGGGQARLGADGGGGGRVYSCVTGLPRDKARQVRSL